jgi:hypothetical protein
MERYKSKFEEQPSIENIILDYFQNQKITDEVIKQGAKELMTKHKVIRNVAVTLSRKPGNAGDPLLALINEINKILKG